VLKNCCALKKGSPHFSTAAHLTGEEMAFFKAGVAYIVQRQDIECQAQRKCAAVCGASAHDRHYLRSRTRL